MTYRSASPATKSAELIERLGDLANVLEINDFDLRQLEREARRLLAADAAGAYEILGAVASLRGDAESVHGEHKRALNLSRESHDSLYNYAVSLGVIGDFDGAREAACKAFKKAPTDRETLMRCIEFSTMSGHLLEARQLICCVTDSGYGRAEASGSGWTMAATGGWTSCREGSG